MVELDNGTEFVIDPHHGQVQTVTRGHCGFVLKHSMVSMEQFLADGEEILKRMQDG